MALKEEDYEEEIKNNNSDRIYRKARWLLPAIAVVISIFSIGVSIWKKSNVSIQLIQPVNQAPPALPNQNTINERRTSPIDSGWIGKTASPKKNT